MTQHSAYQVIMFLTIGGYALALFFAGKAVFYVLDMFDHRNRFHWHGRKALRGFAALVAGLLIAFNVGSGVALIGQWIMPARPTTRIEALRVCQDAMYSRFIACVEGYGYSVDNPNVGAQ